MPHHEASRPSRRLSVRKSQPNARQKSETRYSVALSSGLAHKVEKYAETADASISKSIATLVRLGLESQERRKRDFFRKLKDNLANDDPKQQDRMIDEFRALILGR
jgi:hypothetical protein